MLKKILSMAILIFPAISFATNSQVKSGTYLNSYKKANISFSKNNDIYDYLLILDQGYSKDAMYFISAKTSPIKPNSTTVFVADENRYAEDEFYEPSKCKIIVHSNQDVIQIETKGECNRSEKSYNGIYAYSKKSSEIPSSFWGRWGDCIEPAFIKKDSFSPDGVYGFGVLGYETNNKTISLYGFSIYEDAIMTGKVTYNFLNDGEVKVKADYWDKPETLKKCR